MQIPGLLRRRGLHIKLLRRRNETLPLPAEVASAHATCFRLPVSRRTRLLANLEGAGKPPSIWILSLIGYAPRKFRDDAFAHSISPDGTTIVFTAARAGGERQGDEPANLVTRRFGWRGWMERLS